jgi:hypothetical protein
MIVLLYLVSRVYDYWSAGDDYCSKHALKCGLEIHLGGTFLVGILTYYLVFLRREARAAGRWRAIARSEPERLFASLPGSGLTGAVSPREQRPHRASRRVRGRSAPRSERRLVEQIVGRDTVVRDVAKDLDETGEPQVIVASSGSGKTAVLLKLAAQLAGRGHVPVPVHLAGVSDLNFERLGRETYRRSAGTRGDKDADEQWEWLLRRKLITVLADELESSTPSASDRVDALERAGRDGLRLVVTCRTDGLPGDFRRGRIDLGELEIDPVIDDLFAEAHERPLAGGPTLSRSELKNLVTSAEMGTTPYFLLLTRALIRAQVSPLPQRPEGLSSDPFAARLHLLSTYRNALIVRDILPGTGMHSEGRRRVLAHLEFVATARLLGIEADGDIQVWIDSLTEAPCIKVPATTAGAAVLGLLVQRRDDHLDFAHPTVLAYYASRCLAQRPEVLAMLFEQERITPLLGLALGFMVAGAPGRDLAVRAIDGLLAHETARPGRAPLSGASDFRQRYGRLSVIALAMEIAVRENTKESEAVDRAIEALETEPAGRGDVATARQRVLEAMGRMKSRKSLDGLWMLATTHSAFAVQRDSTGQLLPGLLGDLKLAGRHVAAAIASAEGHTVASRLALDDGAQYRVRTLRVLAWILPSLRAMAARSGPDMVEILEVLEGCQDRVCAAVGTSMFKTDLEAAIGMGMKIAAIYGKQAAIDRVAEAMLGAGPGRAASWFARVLALQALTIGAVRADPPQTAKAEGILAAALNDPHPFVRQTAVLCQVASTDSSWEPYIWEDTAEAGWDSPNALGPVAAQLVGDIILALNLAAQSCPEARRAFATTNYLPACLSSSADRYELLGYEKHITDCPFSGHGEHRSCLCPYLHELTPGISERRELSRAFCRYQRLTARPLPWQPGLNVRSLKEFWRDMERFAQF